MKLSVNWLKELVAIDIPLDRLIKDIGLRSVEVNTCKPLVRATGLTVGKVLDKIKHPEADKLSVCTVNIGDETLQIVCGAPNVEAGQTVIVAKNGALLPGDFAIKKATIRGVESNGMICSLEELGIDKKYHGEDGIHVLPDTVQAGSDPLKALSYDDFVLDLELTPNKGYLLSMWGVAYDVAALLQKPVTLPNIDVQFGSKDQNRVKVSSTSGKCKSYYARIVDRVTIQESPDWLKARLIAAGIRPISNVVDVTNYVMLEMGQPLHAFDADLLGSTEILVREAKQGESIQTLDEQKRVLEEGDLVITNGNIPVALAGVMGGASTAIHPGTTSILIESAVFDPISIRRTSRRLDLRSESSMRFERGLDPTRTRLAADRCAMLLEQLAGGRTRDGIAFFDETEHDGPVVTVSLAKIASVLGTPVVKDEIASILQSLQFPFAFQDGSFVVSVPSRRRDVATDQDLIEEVLRLYGFEKVPTTLPLGNPVGRLSEAQQLRRKLANRLSDLGLDEAITYSLVSKADAVSFDQKTEDPVMLLHPMTEERAALRHSLLPSLLEAAKYNLSRKTADIAFYELGHVYRQTFEAERLAGVLCGEFGGSAWQGIPQPVDYYLVKGLLESLLHAIRIDDVGFEKPLQALPGLHPGVSAVLKKDGVELGFVGRLHPQSEKQRGLPPTYVFDLSFEALLSACKKQGVMKELSKYPKVERDIAVVVDETILAGDVLQAIRQTAGKTLVEAKVFDVFRGETLGGAKKSLAIALSFQDSAKQLNIDDIDASIAKVLAELNRRYQAVLRQ
jgi:phenylalanyl-tRNA synthetase beta chain